ncbi:MAG: cytidylate kinase-like family protein [Ruminococcaceae bacterium]|nr:cytidylate kinase-like family protein [Oscillospiraceae bacterium]
MANVIITIGRQFGSGGRHIGELVAEKLGLPFYDEKLISLAAEKSDLCREAIVEADERNASSLLYTLAMGSSAMLHSSHYNMPINDKLFLVQSEIIRDAAAKGGAVIVGRCADYILRDHPRMISVFIYADNDFRVKNVAGRDNISNSEAQSLISKTDRRRANYYNFYTGNRWGEMTNYDFAVDSSKLGAEKTAELIVNYAKAFEE